MTRATHYAILYSRVRLKGFEWTTTKIYSENHTTAMMPAYTRTPTLMMYDFSDDHFFLNIPRKNSYQNILPQIAILAINSNETVFRSK